MNNNKQDTEIELRVKQKVERKLKEVFDDDPELDITWHTNDVDGYTFCKICIDHIDSIQFVDLYIKFRPRKYLISISPVIFEDDDPPVTPYLDVEIQPVKLMELKTENELRQFYIKNKMCSK